MQPEVVGFEPTNDDAVFAQAIADGRVTAFESRYNNISLEKAFAPKIDGVFSTYAATVSEVKVLTQGEGFVQDLPAHQLGSLVAENILGDSKLVLQQRFDTLRGLVSPPGAATKEIEFFKE